jgi:hypothetical protein
MANQCDSNDGCGNPICRRQGCQGRSYSFKPSDVIEGGLLTFWRSEQTRLLSDGRENFRASGPGRLPQSAD